jgi:NADP-dependent 3-hydroxy acid dehydrogenase YdfG
MAVSCGLSGRVLVIIGATSGIGTCVTGQMLAGDGGWLARGVNQ